MNASLKQFRNALIFSLLGLTTVVFIYIIDEGGQGFGSILEKQALFEIGLFTLAYTIVASTIFNYLKRMIDSIPAFIVTSVLSVLGGYVLYILMLFILSLFA